MTPVPATLSRSGRRRLNLAAALLCLAGLGALAFVSRADPERATEPTAPLTVRTIAAVEQAEYTLKRRFVGRVEAARESSIGFELGGQVIDVRVDDGDRVTRGQRVARLDTARLEARRAELAAVFEEAAAERELAGSTLQRVRSAHEQNAVSGQRRDEAEQHYRARVAAVHRAEAALASVAVDIAKAELRAPFDAIVARRLVDEGQVIPGGQPVLTLFERRRPEARIGVAESMIAGLARGQLHSVRVGDRSLQAELKAIVPQRDAQTRSVDVLFTLDARLDEIQRGDLATVEIEQTRRESGFWLPLGALTEGSRGLWNCYVAGPARDDGTHELSRRELVVLHQEEDRVFVRGTLRDGERVVSQGVQRLTPRLIVREAGAS